MKVSTSGLPRVGFAVASLAAIALGVGALFAAVPAAASGTATTTEAPPSFGILNGIISQDNAPAAGLCVIAYLDQQLSEGPYLTDEDGGGVATGSGGTYQINVPPGDYELVVASDCSDTAQQLGEINVGTVAIGGTLTTNFDVADSGPTVTLPCEGPGYLGQNIYGGCIYGTIPSSPSSTTTTTLTSTTSTTAIHLAPTTTTAKFDICNYIPLFLRWLFAALLHCTY